jgi:hypothetical protein
VKAARVILAALALVASCAATVEPGEQPAVMHCTTSGAARAALAAVGERETGRGISAGGILVQLYTAPGGSPWTLIITRPGGETCLLARGVFWEVITIPEGSL